MINLDAERSLARRLARFPFRGRFALLFVFLLSSIVIYPYAESSGLGYYAFRVVGTIIILLTVYAVTFSRGLAVLVILLAIPSILQHLLFQPHTQGVLPFVNRMLSLSFDLLIIGIISGHIFRIKKPNSETIFGALCIYLLLGFMFAGVYAAIFSLHANAFYLSPAGNLNVYPDRFDFIYFSFGTLTELGTPGMLAVAPVAKSVSLLEAILGILFMAVLISRLINAYRAFEAPEE
jgi:hypothetical protein